MVGPLEPLRRPGRNRDRRGIGGRGRRGSDQLDGRRDVHRVHVAGVLDVDRDDEVLADADLRRRYGDGGHRQQGAVEDGQRVGSGLRERNVGATVLVGAAAGDGERDWSTGLIDRFAPHPRSHRPAGNGLGREGHGDARGLAGGGLQHDRRERRCFDRGRLARVGHDQGERNLLADGHLRRRRGKRRVGELRHDNRS